MPPLRIVEVGERFGRLTAIERRTRSGQLVRCRCDCGNELTASLSSLGGNTQSCGCLKLDLLIERSTKHGMARSRLYDVWSDMVGRCTRPTHKRWPDYGGRGITVCDRWRDFVNFLEDMGEPGPGLSIDRVNNGLGYSRENCRWATLSEQNLNRRTWTLPDRDPHSGQFVHGSAK